MGRLQKHPYVVHIQESTYNVVIGISDERIKTDIIPDHKNQVIEMANFILNKNLKPNPSSKNLHVSEMISAGQKISKVSWILDSVCTIDKDGKQCIDLVKAGYIGTEYVEAETDGRFVRFEIIKCPGAVNSPYFDPYEERFIQSK